MGKQSRRRRTSQVDVHHKRVVFEPLGVRLLDYNVEIFFANSELLEEFLLDFENYENSQMGQDQQKTLLQHEHYEYIPIKIQHRVDSAFDYFFSQWVAEDNESDNTPPSLFDVNKMDDPPEEDEDEQELFGLNGQ